MGERSAAIVLAAGQGKRMGASVQKQYLMLGDYPILYYSLHAFQESFVDEIILVAGREEIPYCREEIVARHGFSKVRRIVPGGAERYLSVYQGLLAVEDADYVLIHDGARPFVTEAVMRRTLRGARQFGAAAAAMPVTDTIKVADSQGFVKETPKRSALWAMQTPQTFSYDAILAAYEALMEQEKTGKCAEITDDAMALERFSGRKVKLVEGSYENIKITAPLDLKIAELFLRNF